MKKIETERQYNYSFTIGKTTEDKFFADFSTFRFEADTSNEVLNAVITEINKDFAMEEDDEI